MSKDMQSRSESIRKPPQPWEQASLSDLTQIRGVCLDIDDTLSTAGKLTAEAFSALWELKKAGFAVVPVTGRPAGWCDHIARFWPVDAVVGENGAFTFFMDQGVRKRMNTPTRSSDETLKKQLYQLSTQIQSKFPHAKWASDQSYREYDLAVDMCEDVEPWSAAKTQELLQFCKDQGAHAKLSSIHVNIWYGDYDKRKGFEHWISQGHPGWNGKKLQENQWLYIGDSPNDEPMFATFPFSVGVANLKKYIDQLQHTPTWLTLEESGKGFAEMVRKLSQIRTALP
jgi:HAD superfamily hydrolase (TIGR01484 family)